MQIDIIEYLQAFKQIAEFFFCKRHRFKKKREVRKISRIENFIISFKFFSYISSTIM